MGNIDEKTLSAILGRIDSIREELEALEYEVKAILEPAVAEEPEAVVEPELTAEPEPVEEPAPVEEPVPAEEPEPVDVMDDIPQEPIDLSISDIDIPEEEPVETAKPILDTAKADTAVMDVLAERQAWRIDRPGSAVKNVISAISLSARIPCFSRTPSPRSTACRHSMKRQHTSRPTSRTGTWIPNRFTG